jgi:hypothetical protein
VLKFNYGGKVEDRTRAIATLGVSQTPKVHGFGHPLGNARRFFDGRVVRDRVLEVAQCNICHASVEQRARFIRRIDVRNIRRSRERRDRLVESLLRSVC